MRGVDRRGKKKAHVIYSISRMSWFGKKRLFFFSYFFYMISLRPPPPGAYIFVSTLRRRFNIPSPRALLLQFSRHRITI